MKSYMLKIVGILVGIVCFFTHCKKFVQIDPPTTELVTASVFNNSATATSAQTTIYSEMYANKESSSMAEYTGLLSDELTNYSTAISNVQFYTNAMTAEQGTGPWVTAYNYIYQANAIIAALQNNSAIAPSIVAQLTGESKFIRAFWFFYLTNLYGDIPLVTNTDYATNATISRTPRVQVYTQIISDLKDAQALLSSNYVDASDTTVTTERTRPTKWAATALLARVYLFTGDYTDAKTQASSVISNTGLYSLCPNLNNVFLANSTECIWQLAIPLPTFYNTYDGYLFILTSAPNNVAISPQLLNSFEQGDSRRLNWIDSFQTSTSPTYYYPYKYKVQSGTNVTEYEMILRLAEQYLIRAEAEAQLNDLTDAVSDLDVIRTRAGLGNIPDSIASSESAMLTAILHERQVELFTEWGNRWFDIIRTGVVNSVMGTPGNVCQFKEGSWVPTDTLYPIPQSERTLDPNLTQNLGY
jgi:starch-binding outer membrane protein, SusD/RagB family